MFRKSLADGTDEAMGGCKPSPLASTGEPGDGGVLDRVVAVDRCSEKRRGVLLLAGVRMPTGVAPAVLSGGLSSSGTLEVERRKKLAIL